MLRAVVLGAAAGGGFPQWNSNAPACCRARLGDPAALPRTQASLAISGNGEDWIVLNASPDLREQIGHSPCLHPKNGLRSSPIVTVVLTGGDIDAIAGLLTLRERQDFSVLATRSILEVLSANPIFEVLAPDTVTRTPVPLDAPVPLAGGLTLELFAVPGKKPLYLEESDGIESVAATEFTVGAQISDGGSALHFIPSCAELSPALKRRLRGAKLIYFDGTFWRDDEMLAAGLGTKSGRRMGHISISGKDGAIAAFAGLEVTRKIFVHVNNSNPILLADSQERTEAENAGWEVAYDGMEIVL